MASPAEIAEKQRRVNELLDSTGSDALLLSGSDNFAWFTCGGSSYVNQATEGGVGALLIHRDRKTLIANNVERGRLIEEECGGQGFFEEIVPWTEDAVDPIVYRIAPGEKIISDLPSGVATVDGAAIGELRRSLTSEEVARYRALGKDVGEALGEACMLVEPGMTEYEVAAALADEHYARRHRPHRGADRGGRTSQQVPAPAADYEPGPSRRYACGVRAAAWADCFRDEAGALWTTGRGVGAQTPGGDGDRRGDDRGHEAGRASGISSRPGCRPTARPASRRSGSCITRADRPGMRPTITAPRRIPRTSSFPTRLSRGTLRSPGRKARTRLSRRRKVRRSSRSRHPSRRLKSRWASRSCGGRRYSSDRPIGRHEARLSRSCPDPTPARGKPARMSDRLPTPRGAAIL